MSEENSNTSGISFMGVLFIVFLTLKLTNVITWSWWWVTAPLWLPITLILIVIACVVGIGLCVAGIYKMLH